MTPTKRIILKEQGYLVMVNNLRWISLDKVSRYKHNRHSLLAHTVHYVSAIECCVFQMVDLQSVGDIFNEVSSSLTIKPFLMTWLSRLDAKLSAVGVGWPS